MRNGSIITIVFLFLWISLSGCYLRLLSLEMGVVRAAGVERVALSTASRSALVSRATVSASELSVGRIAIADEAAFNSQLRNITLRRVSGKNPKLYVQGESKPFAEVLTDRNKIRILETGRELPVNSTVFSVEGEMVNVRSYPNLTGNVVTTLRRGDMVVKLAEVEDGWYKVKVINNQVETVGFIKANLLALVVAASTPDDEYYDYYGGYSYLELKAGAIPFPNEDKMKSDLVGKNIAGWFIESIDDIISVTNERSFLNGDGSYYVNVGLKLEYNNILADGHVVLRYNLSNGIWVFRSISDGSYSIQDLKSPYNRQPVSKEPRSGFNDNHAPRKYTGVLKVLTANHSPIRIAINGREYDNHGKLITLNNIPIGQHRLKVFSYSEGEQVGSSRFLNETVIEISDNTITYVVYNIDRYYFSIQQMQW